VPDVAVDVWRLSSRGIEQAAKLSHASFWDQVDRVIVSSEPKTWLTVVDVVGARRLSVWIDSRFDELRRGGWIDDYAVQVAMVFAEPSRSIYGWEAANATRARMQSGLADLNHRFADETLALVGHGLSLSLPRAEILGHTRVDFDAWQRLDFGSYASITLNPPTMVEDFTLNVDTMR
jgi:broad specificity phosphatase PhoE